MLRVSELGLSIHQQRILDGINFTVDRGQVLGIVGESGSGKSMTAYSIMQLLPHGSVLQGSVSLDDFKLSEMDDEQMCSIRGDHVSMVFQEPLTALNPVKNIGDQVAETIRIHTDTSQRSALTIAAEMLDKVGLPSAQFPLSRFPHELSGGQRQRVVMAMAIARKPSLLIADEPTTALDVTTQAQVLEILKRLVQDDNMGLILITHDLAVVSQVADTILIMQEGRIVEHGEVTDVLTNKRHAYTRALFSASGHIPERAYSNDDSDEKEVPLLKVDGLIRDYRTSRKNLWSSPGTFRAVDKVSFSIARGECVGLVGESGCGKSTLTRAILGLDKTQGGEIAIDGESVIAGSAMPRHMRQKMQVVFQDPYGSFNPRHRVSRLVAEPFYLLDQPPVGKERTARIVQTLQSVGLNANDANKYIHEFSGGQRQRIAIARALIVRPSLIILDEAVSALDVSVRAQILDLLVALIGQYDLSYLFISHDLSVVRSISDRVLVMKNGVIVERGETEMVFNAPQHRYTQTLIAAIPQLEHGS